MIARSGMTPTGALRQTIVIVPALNLVFHSGATEGPSMSSSPRVPVPAATATAWVARVWPLESTTADTVPSAFFSNEVGEA